MISIMETSQLVLIITLIYLFLHGAAGNKVVLGLNEHLEQFTPCTIQITADFKKTNFESFEVPVALIDVYVNKRASFFYFTGRKCAY